MSRLDRSAVSVEAVCSAIRSAHRAYPNMRVGQILVNALPDRDPAKLFYIENDELARALYSLNLALNEAIEPDDG